MQASLRTLRALSVLGSIFGSYVWQLTLARLYGRRRSDWLGRRRARVDAHNAERLLQGILRLRGVYIKLGQVLSIMGSFLPPVYRQRLETLQDRVPPRPFEAMSRVFGESLGRQPDACFREIAQEPIAAASLGQVHEAWLDDGTRVAVKILYPDVRALIRTDMRVVRLALSLYRHFMPINNLYRIHDALVDLLARETDYLREAEAMQRLASNFAEQPEVLCPKPIAALTSRDVLTMTFMEGIKITHVDALRAQGIDPDAVGRRLIQVFFKQLFVDRYFHADPHPGNFFVQPGPTPEQPRLVILDFGAVTEAPSEQIDGMVELIHGFFAQDGAQVLRGVERIGFVAEHGDRSRLEQTVLMYFRRLLQVRDHSPGAMMRASPSELRELLSPDMAMDELRSLARSFTYPTNWLYIERALVMLFWLVGQIAPNLDLLKVGFPYILPLLSRGR